MLKEGVLMAEQITKLKNLEKLRKLHDLSVDELMERLGRNRVTYYTWQEKGALPSSDVVKLHEIFDVSTDLLLDVKPLLLE